MLIIHTIAVLLLLVGFAPSLMSQPRGNPESPFVHELVPSGQMFGALKCLDIDHPEEFGVTVSALGDVNHDSLADWAVSRVRCDTVVDNFGFNYRPLELLLYRGVRGGLPSVASGQRIGPTEIGSETKFLACGDWDGDHNRDIAVSIRIFNDTTSGNSGYALRALVVFWGSANGRYSLQDTTHLLCPLDKCIGLLGAISTDLDGDNVDDLLVWGGGAEPRHTDCYRTDVSIQREWKWWLGAWLYAAVGCRSMVGASSV